jgi:hypothetical protein
MTVFWDVAPRSLVTIDVSEARTSSIVRASYTAYTAHHPRRPPPSLIERSSDEELFLKTVCACYCSV